MGESSHNLSVGAQRPNTNPEPTQMNLEPAFDPLLLVNPESQIQPDNTVPEPDNSEPSGVGSCAHGDLVKMTGMGRTHQPATLTAWIDWRLILTDGRRIAIPEFSASSWDSTQLRPYCNENEVIVLPIAGV